MSQPIDPRIIALGAGRKIPLYCPNCLHLQDHVYRQLKVGGPRNLICLSCGHLDLEGQE